MESRVSYIYFICFSLLALCSPASLIFFLFSWSHFWVRANCSAFWVSWEFTSIYICSFSWSYLSIFSRLSTFSERAWLIYSSLSLAFLISLYNSSIFSLSSFWEEVFWASLCFNSSTYFSSCLIFYSFSAMISVVSLYFCWLCWLSSSKKEILLSLSLIFLPNSSSFCFYFS